MIDKVDIKEVQKGICYLNIAMDLFDNSTMSVEFCLQLAQKIIKKNEALSIICLEKVFDELDKLSASSIDTGLDFGTEESLKTLVFAFEIVSKSTEQKQKSKLFSLAQTLVNDEIKKIPNQIITDVNLEVNLKRFFNKYV